MSKILEGLRADPTVVYEFQAKLPSGNRFQGTVGPMLNGRVAAQVGFESNPPSQQDIEQAQRAMNELMGCPPAETVTTYSAQELDAAMSMVRKFMGGGQG